MSKLARAPGASTGKFAPVGGDLSYLDDCVTEEAPSDRLDVAKAEARKLRDKTLEVKNLEERIKELNIEIQTITFQTLPQLLIDIGMDHVGVPPTGNEPGIDFVLKDFYYAIVKADAPQAEKAAAFEVLRKWDLEEIIKKTFIVECGKGEDALAKRVRSGLQKANIPYMEREGVHQKTLTAAVKQRVERQGKEITNEEKQALNIKISKVVEPRVRKNS